MSEEEARGSISADVDAALSALPDDLAAVEHLAATYAVVFETPGDRAGSAELLTGALLERADERAAAVLAGLAEMGSPEIARPARAALDHLRALELAGTGEYPSAVLRVAEAWVEPE